MSPTTTHHNRTNHRRTFTTLAVAGLVAVGAAGCLRQGVDYQLRGGTAVLSRAVTAELVGRWNACDRTWWCGQTSFRRWNFDEQHFFDNHAVADGFRVHESAFTANVAPALNRAAGTPGLCLAVPAGWGTWTTAPC
jgi:hypothetical protein